MSFRVPGLHKTVYRTPHSLTRALTRRSTAFVLSHASHAGLWATEQLITRDRCSKTYQMSVLATGPHTLTFAYLGGPCKIWSLGLTRQLVCYWSLLTDNVTKWRTFFCDCKQHKLDKTKYLMPLYKLGHYFWYIWHSRNCRASTIFALHLHFYWTHSYRDWHPAQNYGH